MTTVNTYLYFNGTCEAAFNFYKAVFKKEFQYIGRYKDVPEAARVNFPNCTDEQIMHVALPISKETVLLGADIIELNKKETKNNFSLFLSTDSKAEAERLFNALSEGGKITIPLSDQFGINWKISCS